jgi:two-component system LytT family sensor kinase
VLLTLAENIFKHGQFTNQQASLDVYIHNNLLVIESDNVSSRLKQARQNGTGLLNIEQRLKYAYGDAALFNHAQDGDGHFKVRITVPVSLLHETAAI